MKQMKSSPSSLRSPRKQIHGAHPLNSHLAPRTSNLMLPSSQYDHLHIVETAFTEKPEPKNPPKPRTTIRPYAELRTASAFSFLDSASLPEDLIATAAQRDVPAVALIDRNGVYGAPRFYMAAKKCGVRA